MGGRSNNKINVSKLALLGSTGGAPLRIVLEDKVVVDESTEAAPALASYKGRMFLAWTGIDNGYLNLRLSRDGTFQPPDP